MTPELSPPPAVPGVEDEARVRFRAGTLSLVVSVILLGAGRAATFPALVPGFSLIIGFLALGVVPSWPQVAGLLTVWLGFYFTLR